MYVSSVWLSWRTPPPLPPPPCLAWEHNGWLGRSAFTLTKRACYSCHALCEKHKKLLTLFLQVLAPLLSNSKNHKQWPHVVSQDVMRHVHHLKSNVYVVAGQVKGKTLLPLPVGSDRIPNIDDDVKWVNLQCKEKERKKKTGQANDKLKSLNLKVQTKGGRPLLRCREKFSQLDTNGDSVFPTICWWLVQSFWKILEAEFLAVCKCVHTKISWQSFKFPYVAI